MKYIIEFKDERTSVWQRSMLWDKQYEEAERDSILHGMGSTWRSVPAVDTSFDTAKRLREHLEWVLETLSYTSERLVSKAQVSPAYVSQVCGWHPP